MIFPLTRTQFAPVGEEQTGGEPETFEPLSHAARRVMAALAEAHMLRSELKRRPAQPQGAELQRSAVLAACETRGEIKG